GTTSSGPYAQATDPLGKQLTPPQDNSDAGAFRMPFGHLLNFFQSGLTYIDPANYSNTQQTVGTAAHLYRLLDFVEVPSPFSGTERWYNASQFGWYNSATSQVLGVPHYYRPPFNKLSRFRDPGRV